MSLLSLAQQRSSVSSSVSAEHRQHDQALSQEDGDQDAEWLSAQVGASVGCMHRIVRHLASGGMGHVFVAEHVHLGAQAAVKVPRYADAHGRRILEAEAKLLAKLEHPNIVRALDVGQLAEGRAYLLMEYATGIELDSLLDARGTMSFERCLAVLKQVASAVDYLHVKGIVHGDIKPANLLIDVSANDFVKLVDFGIASTATRNERRGVLGTPAYMSPEQARGDAWGPLSDVYAVAALALEMLTGQPPHHYQTAQDVLTALLTEPAPLPSARGLMIPGLDAVFERGLHPEPAQRYARASAFVSALAEALTAQASEVWSAQSPQQGILADAVPLQPPVADAVGRQPDSSAHTAVGVLATPMVPITPIAQLLAIVARGRKRGSPQVRPLWRERAVRRVAACLVAAAYIVSVYG